MTPLLQKAAAEAIGTFALVFAGCGAIMTAETHGEALGHGGVAAVFGLVVGVMIYATGHISGAHFNPAVTLAFAVVGRFAWREAPAYLAAQLSAAGAAAAALGLVFGDVADLGTSVPTLALERAFALEVVLTFLLMFVIIGVATDARAEGTMAGVAIGSTVALGALFGGPSTGASMNPARSLGPALVSGNTDALWLYVTAPCVGACVAALVYERICCNASRRDAKGCC